MYFIIDVMISGGAAYTGLSAEGAESAVLSTSWENVQH